MYGIAPVVPNWPLPVGVNALAAGGLAFLRGESDGLGIDFTYTLNPGRVVAVKTAGVVTFYALDDFLTNATTSAKRVYDSAGAQVWAPHNLFVNSATPATQAPTLITGATYTVRVTGSGTFTGSNGASAAGAVTEASGAVTFVASGTTGTFTLSGSLTTIQLNRGSSLVAYLETTGSARFGCAIDYDPATLVALGLLSEPQATNLVLQSGAPSNWLVSGLNSSLTADYATSPDGLTKAIRLIDDSGGGSSTVATVIGTGNSTVATATAYTLSVYAKADQLSWLALNTTAFTTPGNVFTYFNLSAGTVGSQGTGHTGKIVALPNGWYRCSITFTTDASDTSGQVRAYLANGDGDTNVDLDGTSSVLLWGGQLEIGTVATSPIETFGSTVTRSADLVQRTGGGFPQSSLAMSSFVEVDPNGQSMVNQWIGFGAGNDRWWHTHNTSFMTTTFKLNDDLNGVNSTIARNLGTPYKVAARYKEDECGASYNGETVQTDTTTDARSTTITSIYFSNFGTFATTIPLHFRSVVLVPRAWSDNELQTKTAA